MDVTKFSGELKAWIKGLQTDEARDEFARRCETSIGHLRNVSYGKKCSPELATLIEIESGGVVRRWHLRPWDWHRIWPELTAERTPPVHVSGASPVRPQIGPDRGPMNSQWSAVRVGSPQPQEATHG